MSESNSSSSDTWTKYAKYYDPLKIGSIDGTDTEPHDKGIVRAINSNYTPNRFVKGHPECTIFISRLNPKTTKDTIMDIFSRYGKIKRFRLVRDIVTGMPKGYAFIEYETDTDAAEAYQRADKMVIDGRHIFVDFECERLLKGWKPRRLGGGFGGKKESGQLRFGGRDRPFKKPIQLELKEREYRDRQERESRRCRDDDDRKRIHKSSNFEDDYRRRRRRSRSRSRSQYRSREKSENRNNDNGKHK